MADNFQDKIAQIRARRTQTNIPSSNQRSGYNPSNTLGTQLGNVNTTGLNRVADVGQRSLEDILGPDFKSPWLQDRVSLSPNGQIALVESRLNGSVNSVDLGYTNRVPILPLQPGVYVRIEPPGTYRLTYHLR